MLYYNPGTHISSETGATDYVYQDNLFFSRMTEGIAWKRSDENGYLNNNSVSSDDIDILLMGSSHMEAMQLFDNQTTAYLLNEMLDMSLYDIGMSAHTLMVNVKNLDNALETFTTSKYVILESAGTAFSDTEINECLEQTMSMLSPDETGGVLKSLIRNVPCLGLCWHQIRQFLALNDEEIEENDEVDSVVTYSQKSYDALMAYISEVCQAHDVQPIIFYHPNLVLSWDGSVSSSADEASLYMLQMACEENGIVFVDMTQDFIDMYYEDHVLPTGFCNTAVGTGHMNQYGHRAVAERLAAVITDLEESGEVVAS